MMIITLYFFIHHHENKIVAHQGKKQRSIAGYLDFYSMFKHTYLLIKKTDKLLFKEKHTNFLTIFLLSH